MARIGDLLPLIEGGPAIKAKLDKGDGWARLAAAMGGLKERAKTLRELIDGAHYLFADRPIALDEKAAKLLDADGRAALAALIPRLEAVDDWTAPALEGAVRVYADQTGLKLGKVAQPVRAALTGRSVSPPVFDVMAVLGRDESLARLKDAR